MGKIYILVHLILNIFLLMWMFYDWQTIIYTWSATCIHFKFHLIKLLAASQNQTNSKCKRI